MSFLYVVCNVKLQLHPKGPAWSRVGGGGRGREAPPKTSTFYFLCIELKKQFSTHVFKSVLVQCAQFFLRIIRGLNQLPLLRKDYSFSLKIFYLTIFMGNPSLRLSEVLSCLGHIFYKGRPNPLQLYMSF